MPVVPERCHESHIPELFLGVLCTFDSIMRDDLKNMDEEAFRARYTLEEADQINQRIAELLRLKCLFTAACQKSSSRAGYSRDVRRPGRTLLYFFVRQRAEGFDPPLTL